MNVQDLASLSDQILQITGLRVRETVPDWVFQQADEVVVVDVTPRALLHRLERGAILSSGKTVPRFRSAFFRSPRSWPSANSPFVKPLRLWKPGPLPRSSPSYTPRKFWSTLPPEPPPPCSCAAPAALRTIFTPRVSPFLFAQLPEFSSLPAPERQAIERHLHFAENLRIETAIIHGKNRADTLVNYAHENAVTQIFIGPAVEPPKRWFRGLDFTDQVLYQARDLEVTVVAERSGEGGRLSLYPEDEAAG